MILIFSDKSDHSTSKVMAYLSKWKEEVIRINREDTTAFKYNITLSSTGGLNIEIIWGRQIINIAKIKSIWFRRGGLYFKKFQREDIVKDSEYIYSELIQYFSDEQMTLNTFIFEAILSSNVRVLGNPFLFNSKKLSVLSKAIACGLNIPNTLVTTEKNNVEAFLTKNGNIITKAIQDNFSVNTSIRSYALLTKDIDKLALPELPSEFFPSLFQNQLNKKYDIRIFFLDGSFYSNAIFSQANERTKLDFRNYDLQNPNRISIIQLPLQIRNKLKRLLKALNLNTASIDMVYTNDDKFVFLEVNPVGQYDWLSEATNLQLDKKIALWLSNG